MDGPEEKIEDQALAERLRRQARQVHKESILAAAVLTALCLAIPAGGGR